MNKRLYNVIYYFILAALTAVILYSAFNIFKIKQDNYNVEKTIQAVRMPIAVKDPFDYMDKFRLTQKENKDFIGWIKFESNLINLPVMFDGTDDYLYKDFNGEYSKSGTPFINENQNLDSRNITIYGHYVYADPNAIFSPLDELRYEENYEKNKIAYLYLDNEIRKYEVASILEYDSSGEQDDFLYENANFTNEEWTNFLKFAEFQSKYETNVTFSDDSRYLTLQTCIKWNDVVRNIIFLKEIMRETPYYLE